MDIEAYGTRIYRYDWNSKHSH